MDSIVDIIGTAICFDHLKVDRVVSMPVPTGYGTVKCPFGELPVPAPATKAILETEKIPNYRSDIPQEVLTPTGAAVLAGVVDEYVECDCEPETLDLPGFFEGDIKASGRGKGNRQTGLPALEIYICE